VGGARRMTAYAIGLTGPIGAGKSTVAQMLRELGAKVIDADAIVHQEQSRGTLGYTAIVQQFGTHVLGEDREIDRKKLAEEVFGDPRKLEQLERIIHPRVVARVLEARAMLADDAILVVEAIKLLDSVMRGSYDEIWVVLAPRDVMMERLRERGMSAGEAEARLRHQRSDAEFRARAHVVIESAGDREATRTQVRAAYEASKARARSSRGAGT